MMQEGVRLRQRGVTLVELILSIVVIGVGLAGVVMVINRNVLSSADPMAQHQAVAIAEAYMEEILTKDFCDPANTCVVAGVCQVCPAAEANREDFDNVCDYNGRTDNGAVDQTGAAIVGLGDYAIQTTVDDTATLGVLTGGNCEVVRAEVRVTGPGGVDFTLRAFRTNY